MSYVNEKNVIHIMISFQFNLQQQKYILWHETEIVNYELKLMGKRHEMVVYDKLINFCVVKVPINFRHLQYLTATKNFRHVSLVCNKHLVRISTVSS